MEKKMDNDATFLNMPESQTPPPEPQKKLGGKIWIIIAAVALLLICCCLAATAALFYFDPFDWGILGRLIGGYDPVAKTMRADSDLYISLDLLKFLSADSREVFDAFASSAENSEFGNRDEFISNLDEGMKEAYGVTFTDDIQPWIGQYLGLSFLDLELDSYGGPESSAWLAVAESRDKKAAAEFITKLVAETQTIYGSEFRMTTYEGVDIYELITEYEDEQFAVATYKSYVYLAKNAQCIQDALDAYKGDSLYENEELKDTLSSLPDSHILSAFISPDFMTSVVDSSLSDSGFQADGFNAARSIGMSLSTTNEGVQIDYAINYIPENMNEYQNEKLNSDFSASEIIGFFPENTLFFVADSHLDLTWKMYRQMIVDNIGSEDDFNESMQLLENEIGFNPDRQLLPILDGVYGIGVFNESGGLIQDELEIPLGLLGVFGSSQPDQLQRIVSDTANNLERLGLVNVNQETYGNMTYYEMSIFLMGGSLPSFGTQGEYLFLGTSVEALLGSQQSGRSLKDNALLIETWDAFPSNMEPIGFINFREFLTLIEDINYEQYPALNPIKSIGIAQGPLKGNTQTASMILFIDK
jgi:hypothetical protein